MNKLKQSLLSLPTPALPSFGPTSCSDLVPPPLPQPRLDAFTHRRDISSSLQTSFQPFLKNLAKQRPDPSARGNATAPPAKWLGQTMMNAAHELKDVDEGLEGQEEYRIALSAVGDLHLQLADISIGLADSLSVGYLTTLEQRSEEHKQFDKAVKEAEKKRSALEAVTIKAEKGKKDPSEYETEREKAEWDYNDEADALSRHADKLEAALADDVASLRQLVNVQLVFARNYVELLETCATTMPSISAPSFQRSRSASLQVPLATARMSRSQSDSSVRGDPAPPSSSFFSSLGPNRTRRSTVSSQASEKDTPAPHGSGESSTKNRSRSGSVLERFALGNKGKKRESSAPTGDEDQGGDDQDPSSPPSSGGTSSSSRFTSSSLNMPGLPTLGSIKKFATATGGSKYGSLADEPKTVAVPTSPLHTSFSSSPRPGSSNGARMTPPLFKRTQTAPPSTSSSPSPSSPLPSQRRAVPPLPPSTFVSQAGPVGKTYRAQWAHVPAAHSASGLDDDDDDDDQLELRLSPGDIVRVENEVNSDWWIGSVLPSSPSSSSANFSGRRGMFPSAYVVPCEESAAGTEDGERRRPAGEARWTTFANDSTSLFGSAEGAGSTDGEGGSVDESDGEDVLLARRRSASPFHSSAPHPPAAARVDPDSAPMAPRRTAPRPPASRSRSTTVTKAQAEASPFGDD
ncbi:hypothetical protein JCM11641_007147 [Rhodosporidiobolus odoratus]